eukprot:g8821.t1
MVEQLNQKKPPGQRAPLCTLDFSTLYTSLPQSQLIHRLSNYIRATYSHKFNIDRSTHLYFSFNKHTHSYKPPVWCSRPPPSQDAYDVLLDADKFIEFLTLQIENSFIAFGELVLQQTIGIPVGEFDFFLQLINLYRIPLIHAFVLTERFLDDLLSLNNSDFNKHRYHTRPLHFHFSIPQLRRSTFSHLSYRNNVTIYALYNMPRFRASTLTPSSKLKLNTTTPLPFLDIQIKYDERSGQYYVDHFAKELSAKYKAIQFNRYRTSDQHWHPTSQPTFSTPQHAICSNSPAKSNSLSK